MGWLNWGRIRKEKATPDSIAAEFGGELVRIWRKQLENFSADAVSDLTSREEGKIDEKTMKEILSDAESYLSTGFATRCKRLVRESQRDAFSTAKRRAPRETETRRKAAKTQKAAGTEIVGALREVDRAALAALEKVSISGLSGFFGEMVAPVFGEKLREYFKSGMTNRELAKILEEEFSGKIPEKVSNHFQLLADHWTFRTAEMGRVSAYREAAVEYAEVLAVLDGRTSRVCQQMHGRLIPVSRMESQVDRLVSAGTNKMNLIRAQRMFSEKEADSWTGKSTSSLLRKNGGLGMPPYHFRCRTTTAAYFGDVSEEIYPRREGEYANKIGYRDTELKNILDGITRWSAKGKFAMNPRLADMHMERHGKKNYGLTKMEDYHKLHEKTVKNAKEKMAFVYEAESGKEFFQICFYDGKNYCVCGPDNFVDLHPMSQKNWNRYKKKGILL